MNKRNPEITVLMPAYNAANYIGEAIRSVLGQSFTDFELLIVNDGSTDETEQVIRSFADERIVLMNQDRGGIAAALNRGLAAARSEIIARFDADDVCYPGRLEAQYHFLAANPDHVIVGCDADYYDMNDEYVFTYRPPGHSDAEIRALYFYHCPFVHSGVMYRRRVILDAGGYDLHAHAFEDHLLWTKVIPRGLACNLTEILLKVRLHTGSVCIDEKWRTRLFCRIKYGALEKGSITKQEGDVLQRQLEKQEDLKIKQGAYYAMLAKKYLWDNYQPLKARTNLKKIMRIRPANARSYFLYGLSYMPGPFIKKFYTFFSGTK
jgi:glycosyltransferase involved in cell wall biosynthesis